MKQSIGRRSFLRMAGAAIGIGAIHEFAPMLAHGAAADPVRTFLRRANGEAPRNFTFAQFSDTHVGFQGPPDPLGARAFEQAVQLLNRQPRRPDFVLFTGDLTHDADSTDIRARRMAEFKRIAAAIAAPAIYHVPGENDAAIDGGALYRQHFGETHYSFDHKGVHFAALDNVSRGRPEVGAEQLEWLKRDLARFPKTAPIVIFTHRPLFDLKPEWEWFTADGGDVMNALAPYENVTILYGHIHRRHFYPSGAARHYAARSLIFAFNDPAGGGDKQPLPFDRGDPFKNLGIRRVDIANGANAASLSVDDIVLAKAEFGGVSGMQQIIRGGNSNHGSSFDDAD